MSILYFSRILIKNACEPFSCKKTNISQTYRCISHILTGTFPYEGRDFIKFISLKEITKYILFFCYEESSTNLNDRNKLFELKTTDINLNKHSDLSVLREEEFKNTLRAAIKNNDFNHFQNALKICIRLNFFPSFRLAVPLTDALSFHGRYKDVESICEICFNNFYEDFHKNCDFNHFIAQGLWTSGNVSKALKILLEMYHDHPHLQKSVYKMFQRLIINTLHTKGIAQQRIICDHITDYSIKYNEYSLLSIFWFALFQSDWCDDQQLALSILSKNCSFQNYLSVFIPSLASTFLKHHQIDEVYRLMEVLLQCGMESSFKSVILSLFDYYYLVGDLRRCRAVVDCCKVLNVPMNKNQLFKCDKIINIDQQIPPEMKIVKSVDMPYCF